MSSDRPVVPGDSPSATSEQRFLRYVQTGDTGVLDALISDHIDSFFRKARAITGDVDQAEEAIQEAFLKLVRTAHKYDGSVPFGAWLGRLVCAAAFDKRQRARRRHSLSELTDADTGGESTESAASPELDPDQVRSALAQLPEQFRVPLTLHYVVGLDQDDTAKTMGVTLGTLKMRLMRGRERLREKLVRSGRLIPVAGALSLLIALPQVGVASEALKHSVLTTTGSAATQSSSLLIATTIPALTVMKVFAWLAAGAAVVLGSVLVVVHREPESAAIIVGETPSTAIIGGLEEGLVGYWRLDDALGNVAADFSGKGNVGKLVGDPRWTDAGTIGGALAFDGTAQRVSMASLVGMDRLTIAAWVKLDSLPTPAGRGYLIISDPGTYFLRILSDGNCEFAVGTESNSWYTAGTRAGSFGPEAIAANPISAGRWIHLAGTYDGSRTRMYVDGTLIGQGIQDISGKIAGGWDLSLGGRQSGSVVFQVWVDGQQRYDSGIMTRSSATGTVSVDVTGADELRLVVTDAGDGIASDAADWAGARLQQAAEAPGEISVHLSDLSEISATNGSGPIEKDHSVDGYPITLSGRTYGKGLRVHATSEVRYALDGRYTTFASDVGLNDEIIKFAPYNGLIDEARVYDRALTAEEVAALARQTGR